jgi:segregation and condensation protein B
MSYTEEQLASLEALLFIHGEPLTREKIGKLLGAEDSAVSELIAEYGRRLAAADRGLALVESDGRVQLATKPQFSHILEAFVKSELSEELSPASLETLAIVAYFAPISRARIDYQRGVNSQFILRSLLLRGLVERHPDPAHPNSYLYTPSFEMLKYIGVTKQSDLPNYEKFASLLTRFETTIAESDSPSGEALLQETPPTTEPPASPEELNPSAKGGSASGGKS